MQTVNRNIRFKTISKASCRLKNEEGFDYMRRCSDWIRDETLREHMSSRYSRLIDDGVNQMRTFIASEVEQ